MGYAPFVIFILAGMFVFGVQPDAQLAMVVFGVLAIACAIWVFFSVWQAEYVKRQLQLIARTQNDSNRLRLLKLSEFGRTLFDREKGFSNRAVYLTLDQALDEVGELRRVGLEQVPGVFTALGILFTFYGLVSGLKGFDLTQGSDQMMQDLSVLLSGVGVAFHTSLFGIGLSICALLASRQALAGLGKQVDAVRECAERQEVQLKNSPQELLKTIKNYLVGIDESGKEQSSKLGTLATDLAHIVGDAVKGAVEEVMSEPMSGLKSSFDRFADRQDAQNAAVMKEVMEQFQSAFGEMLGEKLDRFGISLDRTLEWHERTQGMLEGTLNELHLSTNAMRNVLEAEEELLVLRKQEREKSAEVFKQTLDGLATMETSLNELTQAFLQAQSQWQTQSEHVMQSANASREALEKIHLTMGEEYQRIELLIASLNRSISFSQDEYTRLIGEIRKELDTNLRGTFQLFDRSTAEVVNQFSGTLAGIQDTTEELNRALDGVKQTARFVRVES